jgi:hypothetical protein
MSAELLLEFEPGVIRADGHTHGLSPEQRQRALHDVIHGKAQLLHYDISRG